MAHASIEILGENAASTASENDFFNRLLGGTKKLNCADLWEDYRLGHRIRAYCVEARVQGKWTKLSQGTAIGRRKLDLFATVEADRVRVRITQAVAEPVIRRFQVHLVDNTLIAPSKVVPDTWDTIGAWKASDAEQTPHFAHASDA